MSIAKKSFSLFQRDVFLFVTNLVTGIVIARKLGPEVLGLWVILSIIPGYAEAFGRTKADIAAVYYLGTGKYDIGEVKFNLNIVALCSSLIIIVTILWQFNWLYNVLFGNSKINVQLYMYITLLQIPLQFLYMNYTYLYIYQEDIKTYNMMVVIQAIISSFLGILLLVVFNLGLMAVVIASILSLMLALLYGILKFVPIDNKKNKVNFRLIKKLLNYGAKLYIAGIIGHLNIHLTKLILVFYLAPAEVAFFSMAQGKAQLLEKIPSALNTMLFSRIAKMADQKESAILSAKAFRTSLVLVFITGFLGMLLIKPAVILLYGRAYSPIVLPFLIIIPGIVFSAAVAAFNQYFNGIGRADIGAKITIVPLCVQVGLAFLLLPLMGLTGAACALSVALLTTALVQSFVFMKISSLSLKDSMLIGKDDLVTIGRFLLSISNAVKLKMMEFSFGDKKL
jgi:O-antigen/teichoic acid export membrane protein